MERDRAVVAGLEKTAAGCSKTMRKRVVAFLRSLGHAIDMGHL